MVCSLVSGSGAAPAQRAASGTSNTSMSASSEASAVSKAVADDGGVDANGSASMVVFDRDGDMRG